MRDDLMVQQQVSTVWQHMVGVICLNVREKRLRQMSKDYLTWDGEDATQLYGIGKYGSDSYELFYKKRVPENIGDHELKRYVEEEFYAV
jgi:hypothetical protein